MRSVRGGGTLCVRRSYKDTVHAWRLQPCRVLDAFAPFFWMHWLSTSRRRAYMGSSSPVVPLCRRPRIRRPSRPCRVWVRRTSESRLGQQPGQLSSTVLPDLVIVYGALASSASVDCPAHASGDDRLARGEFSHAPLSLCPSARSCELLCAQHVG